MVFFGDVIDKEGIEVEVPDGYNLHILQACLSVEQANSSIGKIALQAETAHTGSGLCLSILDPQKGVYHCALTHSFGPEDNPVRFTAVGGALHLTGKWSWDESVEDDSHNEEDDEEEEEEDSDDEEEPPMLVESIEEVINEKSKKEKRKLQEINTDKNLPEKRTAAGKVQFKAPLETASAPDNSKESKSETSNLKPWKIKPVDDEGITVPQPKPLKKQSGLVVTDYVIGKGAVPKFGSKVKIIYEGMFPSGKIFDANLKRKKPFIFRKGTGQVIKGMDLGIEGMKIGGSREIVVPSELG